MMNVAVIGAGVNGICCALSLAEKGCKVTIYESKAPFSETSSKSSKLLHGGIRYLESFQIKLVKEALADRAWWIKNAEQYTRINRFFIPIYRNKSRSRLKLFLGVKIYEWLAGSNSLGKSHYHNRKQTLALNPVLSSDGLLGSVSYIDVQMDDRGLSEWLINKAKSAGVVIQENTPIQRVGRDGSITKVDGKEIKYDKVVNVCGPWAKKLIEDSDLRSEYSLALVKGSHIYVDRFLANPLVIQIPEDCRIVFALPCDRRTLIGTTELKHEISDQINCSEQELMYLINAANSVFAEKLKINEGAEAYAGVRPIVSSEQKVESLSKANRESTIETIGNLTNVFGGKWTSAMRLGNMVSEKILKSKEKIPC